MNADAIPSDPAGFGRWCDESGIRTVVVGTTDIHGIWRGKRMPVEDFLGCLDRGVAFSDVVLVITHSEDTDEGQEFVEPPGGESYPHYFPRKEQGFPDIFVKADLSTARRLSWHDGTVGVLGDFYLPTGNPVPIGTRYLLRRAVERARDMGFEPMVGLEYEFYIFRGDLRSLKESGYNLDPLQVRPYTYGVYGASLEEEVIGEVRHNLAQAGVWIEACNPETGPGQYELNIRYSDALRAADNGFIYKTGVKEILAKRQLMGSFMAKPRRDWAGSSCHMHQSLLDLEAGRNTFFDHEAGHGLSETGRHYLGGLLTTLREFTALFWPTPNSYKRNVPYSWAASTVSWGIDNRSTGLRAIVEDAASARVEHRVPGADSNPYLAIAACLAAGLHGIENKIEPPEPFQGDAYAHADEFVALPLTLDEALDALEESRLARELLGEDFVEYYLQMKRFEAEKYRQQVSTWEVRRYLETA